MDGFGVAGPSTNWEESAASATGYSVPPRFLWVADVLLQGLAVLAAWRARPGGEVLWVPFVMIPAALLSFQVLGGYRPLLEQSRSKMVLVSTVASLAGVSLVSLVLVAGRDLQVSRSFLFALALFSACGLLVHRAAIRFYKNLRLKAGAYARNVVVVASPPARHRLASHFARRIPPSLYRLVGHLEIPAGRARPSVPMTPGAGATERLGTVDELGDLLIHRPIHQVVAVLASGSEPWLPKVIEQCEFFRVPLRLVPEALLTRPPHELEMMSHGDPLGLPATVLRPHFVESDALFVKRAVDIGVSGILLVVLSPLFLLIALAIKLTSPELPVFYPWRVVGYKGRRFTGYKFTTMTADADRRKADLEHLNEMSGPVFKIKARSSNHAARTASAQVQPERAAAALERAQGRDEPCRPAAGLSERAGSLRALAQAEAVRSAGHHLPLADQWPQPDQQLRRLGADGLRVHRQLVAVARPEDPVAYGGGRGEGQWKLGVRCHERACG